MSTSRRVSGSAAARIGHLAGIVEQADSTLVGDGEVLERMLGS
jgi:hypothetical protein